MLDIFIPVTGMAPDDVTLEEWRKQPGDQVAVGDVVAVVETSKATLEIESEAAGVLGAHLVMAQQSVAPGTTIARLMEPGEREPGVAVGPDRGAAGHDSTPAGVLERVPHTTSPRARRLAAEQTVQDAATVPAVGPPAPRSSGPERHRAAVAAAVSRSWQDIPHFAVTRELRLDRFQKAYRKFRLVLPQITMTDLLLRAVALSFLEREDRTDLDIGLAVATDRGVSIPVIRAVPHLDLLELAKARQAAVDRARSGRAHPDDRRTAVTTLSNLGTTGVDQFTGIVPLGQTSLLTLGRIASRPVVHKGRIKAAVTVHATLNVDHRYWDGQHAAQLLGRLAAATAHPDLLVGIGPLAKSR